MQRKREKEKKDLVRTDFVQRSNDSLGHGRNFMTYKSTSVRFIPESTIHGNLPNDIYKKAGTRNVKLLTKLS